MRIANTIGVPMWELLEIVARLKAHSLLTEV